MRRRSHSSAMAVALLTACVGANEVSNTSPPPDAVACEDAAQHQQHALDDRKLSSELSSDQERIYVVNRANFHASLAIVAELKCGAAGTDADSVLQAAFAAARSAHESSSLYERAFEWGMADFFATQAIAVLIPAAADSTADHEVP